MQSKIDEILSALGEIGADALMMCSDDGILWATGYSGGEAELLITEGQSALYVDARYIEQARAQSCVPPVLSLPAERQRLMAEALAAAGFGWLSQDGGGCCGGCGGCKNSGGGGRTLAIEAQSLTLSRYQELIAPMGIPIADATAALSSLRAVKTQEELNKMRAAAKITQEGFFHLLKFIKPGVSEADLAAELTYFFIKQGASHAFTPIIASGANGSRPHAEVTDKKLAAGELLTMDIGAKKDGWCSDFTRTVAISGVDKELSIVYNTCVRAQSAALSAIRAGESGASLHALAAGIIGEAGYTLPHGLGHGVGTFIHESPRLSAASADVLRAGSVVTVEPGVYIEGFGGVRIEDMVLVTEGGVENFYTADKELIIL